MHGLWSARIWSFKGVKNPPLLQLYSVLHTVVYEARVCKPFRCARARCEHDGSRVRGNGAEVKPSLATHGQVLTAPQHDDAS